MRKTLQILAATLAVVMFSGCSLLQKRGEPIGESGSRQEESKQEVTVSPSPEKSVLPSSKEESFTSKFTGKLKDAVMRSIPMECTWKKDGFSGTGYIKNQKYFGEVASEGLQGYIIMVDNCMWTWNKDYTKGVKICFKPTEKKNSIWDTNSTPEGNYTCMPAAVPDSKFEPPADVNFMNIETMMK